MSQTRRDRTLTISWCTALLAVSLRSPLVGQLEKVVDGFQYVEGPFCKVGVGLCFSDINGSITY